MTLEGRSRWIALYVLCLATLMIVLDMTIVNVALPSIQHDLHFSQAPKHGELMLPSDVARGVLQSLRDVFYHKHPDGFGLSTGVTEPKEGDLPPTAVPEARAGAHVGPGDEPVE